MPTSVESLRDAIQAGYPGSRLHSLTPAELDRLVAEFPTLPAHLRELFTLVGVGTIGRGRYKIHALLSPEDVYDSITAQELGGVVLVGDDFAGVCEAYRITDGQWQFGSVNANGQFRPSKPGTTLVDFLLEWYGEPAAG